jgi:hypothetical protein
VPSHDRAQIKTRFPALEARVAPDKSVVEGLRAKVEGMNDFTYIAGDSRSTFVSSHQSRWRTTVFAANPEEAESVMTRILDVFRRRF